MTIQQLTLIHSLVSNECTCYCATSSELLVEPTSIIIKATTTANTAMIAVICDCCPLVSCIAWRTPATSTIGIIRFRMEQYPRGIGCAASAAANSRGCLGNGGSCESRSKSCTNKATSDGVNALQVWIARHTIRFCKLAHCCSTGKMTGHLQTGAGGSCSDPQVKPSDI
eukprot:COSAG02_NODE_2789_length_8024_cov_8.486183_2_plen_169_part_00